MTKSIQELKNPRTSDRISVYNGDAFLHEVLLSVQDEILVGEINDCTVYSKIINRDMFDDDDILNVVGGQWHKKFCNSIDEAPYEDEE